ALHGDRVVGTDEDGLGRVVDGTEFDQVGLVHRTRVEAGDLRHRGVGGADEARGVRGLGQAYVAAVDTVAGQPRVVLGEVLAGSADQDRARTQAGEAETD